MQALKHFSLPLKGLKNGKHSYTFKVDKSFFDAFEKSPVRDGDLLINVELDKQSNHLEFLFNHEGSIRTECDRCTADIDLPIKGSNELVVKFSEDEKEEDLIVYIHPETHTLNLAKFVFEFIILSLPIVKVYDCEEDDNNPCNLEVLKYLEESNDEKVDNSLWDTLKDLNINN